MSRPPLPLRGATKSSPVRRNARSTASSPSSSAMKLSNTVIQLMEYSWRLRHCRTASSRRRSPASRSPATKPARACSHSGVRIRSTSSAESSRSWAATGPPSSAAREAEHPLRDDVALDLARPTGDRATEGAQVLHGPRPLAPHTRSWQVNVDGVGSEHFDAGQKTPLHRLAAEQLQQGVLG